MTVARSHIRAQTTWIAMMDLACLVIGSAIGVLWRFGQDEMTQYVFRHLEGWFLLYAGILLANYLAGSYRLQYTFSRFNLIVTWAFSLLFALLILSIISYAWFMTILGRGVLFLSLLSYSILALSLKLLVYRSLFRSEFFKCRVAIIGTSDRARSLRRMVEHEYVLPVHQVVAHIRYAGEDAESADTQSILDGVAVIDADTATLEDVVRSLGVSLLIVGFDDRSGMCRLYPHLKRLRFAGVEIMTPLNVAEIYSGLTPLDLVTEETLMQASMESQFPVVQRTKRLLDIVCALLAGGLLFPLMALIALIIKGTDLHSPVFYTQLRVGQFGSLFKIYKFRTMRPDAELDSGAVWASANDLRITRLGRFLRRFRLDELPQLVNVLNGEMSLVGPRPERPEIIAELERRIPCYNERENITPGLTGWAQIRYPYGYTVEDAARKLEYDLYYMKHLSLALDLQIILSTLRIVILGKERNM